MDADAVLAGWADLCESHFVRGESDAGVAVLYMAQLAASPELVHPIPPPSVLAALVALTLVTDTGAPGPFLAPPPAVAAEPSSAASLFLHPVARLERVKNAVRRHAHFLLAADKGRAVQSALAAAADEVEQRGGATSPPQFSPAPALSSSSSPLPPAPLRLLGGLAPSAWRSARHDVGATCALLRRLVDLSKGTGDGGKGEGGLTPSTAARPSAPGQEDPPPSARPFFAALFVLLDAQLSAGHAGCIPSALLDDAVLVEAAPHPLWRDFAPAAVVFLCLTLGCTQREDPSAADPSAMDQTNAALAAPAAAAPQADPFVAALEVRLRARWDVGTGPDGSGGGGRPPLPVALSPQRRWTLPEDLSDVMLGALLSILAAPQATAFPVPTPPPEDGPAGKGEGGDGHSSSTVVVINVAAGGPGAVPYVPRRATGAPRWDCVATGRVEWVPGGRRRTNADGAMDRGAEGFEEAATRVLAGGRAGSGSLWRRLCPV
jgi:hypothetical protein